MARSRQISYYNYPQYYTDYLAPNENEGAQFRLPPVYEFLTEDWQFTVSYIYVQEEQEAIQVYKVEKVEYQPPADLSGEATVWEYDIVGNAGQVTGTWNRIFERLEFDFRMNDESVIVDIEIEDIGYKSTDLGGGAYAPVEYRPDERLAVEGSFIITIGVYDQFGVSKTGTETDTIPQTVLNNWDANRRRLLKYRDNPKRGQSVEADEYGSVSNFGDVSIDENGEYTIITNLGADTVDPVLVEPQFTVSEYGTAQFGRDEYGDTG